MSFKELAMTDKNNLTDALLYGKGNHTDLFFVV